MKRSNEINGVCDDAALRIVAMKTATFYGVVESDKDLIPGTDATHKNVIDPTY